MGKQGGDADALVSSPAAREILAAQHFTTQFDEQFGRGDPAQLHTIVAVLIAEKGLVGEGPIGKLVGMGVVVVEITDIGKEASGTQAESGGQGGSVDEGLLDADPILAVLAFHGQGQLAIKLIVDVGRHGDFALAQGQPLRARTRFARQRKAGTHVAVGLKRVMRVLAIEDDADGGVEGIAIRARGGGAVGFSRGLLAGGHAGLLGLLELFDFRTGFLQRGDGLLSLLAHRLGAGLQCLDACLKGLDMGVLCCGGGSPCRGSEGHQDGKREQRSLHG